MKTQEAVPPPVVKAETAKAVADLTAKAHLARAANPAPVIRRPIVSAPPIASVPPQRRSGTTVLITAAALIVVVIGAAEGARRLGFHWPPQAVREGQPVQAMPAVEGVTVAERRATPPETLSAAKVVAENRAPAVALVQGAAPPKPKTVAERRRTVRQAKSSVQQVVPVVAPTPAPETPAPVPTKPAALMAAESPRATTPPSGRFFERNEVDESPRIATRVAPQIPANLRARARNDIAVVRVLVSRTGHPFRVSLLRGSALGRSSDEAVVAAVTQWTFSPAKKRGETVNCWYNIGVPLGQAN